MTAAATTTDARDALPLSRLLRTSSVAEHRAAERSAVVSAIMHGTLSPREYAQLLAQHYYVYEALETASEAMSADPLAGRFVFPELHRQQALAEDLAYLLGAPWAEQLPPFPATERYRDRIEQVCAIDARAFLAHHYTRYLGDLSGGTLLARAVRRQYGWEPGRGASFYAFPDIPDATAFKARYRALLDGCGLSHSDRASVVEEVRLTYRHVRAVFRDFE
jgi:heme oxygenase